MKNNIIKTSLLLLIIVIGNSCKKEFINPNAATESEVLKTPEGLIAASIGLKEYYATAGIEALYINTGVTSRELKGTSSLQNVQDFEVGGKDLPTYTNNIAQVWNRMFRTMLMADNIIDNAPTVLAAYPQIKSGVIAHANIFKALSLGGLAVAFEKFPLHSDQSGKAPFVTREIALQNAIDLLNEAKIILTATAPSDDFNAKVIGSNFSMLNIINALTARYNLWLKKYADAYTAASQVNLSTKSEFVYNASQGPNPLFTASTTLENSSPYRPRKFFGLKGILLDSADARFAFYTADSSGVFDGEKIRTLSGFYSSASSSIPVYLPDEMRLIKAETILMSTTPIAGTTNPGSVITEIDAVRTQVSGDVFGVYANLPAYSGATDAASLTAEIYKQRCMELFCTGNRLEDSRRLNRDATPANLVERNRNFYPYPDQERQNNTNTPVDPSF